MLISTKKSSKIDWARLGLKHIIFKEIKVLVKKMIKISMWSDWFLKISSWSSYWRTRFDKIYSKLYWITILGLIKIGLITTYVSYFNKQSLWVL